MIIASVSSVATESSWSWMDLHRITPLTNVVLSVGVVIESELMEWTWILEVWSREQSRCAETKRATSNKTYIESPQET
jgi:hypothetical protein